MNLNKNNEYVLDESDLVDLMLKGIPFTDVTVKDVNFVKKYNEFCELYNSGTKINAREEQSNGEDLYSPRDVNNWLMPEYYKNLSIDFVLTEKLNSLGYNDPNSIQHKRVIEELTEYKNQGLEPLLKYIMYLVDFMRENNIIWGVGRGSSTSSYILYLIGIHRIDSIKYKLDFKEFLR